MKVQVEQFYRHTEAKEEMNVNRTEIHYLHCINCGPYCTLYNAHNAKGWQALSHHKKLSLTSYHKQYMTTKQQCGETES